MSLYLKHDNELFYTTYVLNKKGKVNTVNNQAVLNVFSGSKKDEMGNINAIKPLQIDNNEDIVTITNATFSPDGKKLYVTTNYANRRNKPKGNYKESNFHIESAEYKKGIGWTNFKVLPFCNEKYSYSTPSVSPDGKFLYYSANSRGYGENTRGASDLFKVEIFDNNTFGAPQNLGYKINSYGGEIFPYLSKDNTLYFSSDRSNGFGGYDIYKAKMKSNGEFEKPEKLPQPINSDADEFGFIINNESTYGYFSSNRSSGKGDLDIYYFIKS